MPNVPGIGILGDIAGFFWNLALISISAVIFTALYLIRNPGKLAEPDPDAPKELKLDTDSERTVGSANAPSLPTPIVSPFKADPNDGMSSANIPNFEAGTSPLQYRRESSILRVETGASSASSGPASGSTINNQ